MNNKIILTSCLFIFAISCRKSEPNAPTPINPKQYTSLIERDYTWKAIVREYCSFCTPSYDSTYDEGYISFYMEVIDDSTIYNGNVAYNKLTEYDLFHYVRHDEKGEYTYFECPRHPYVNQSLKYFYKKNKVELFSKLDSAGVRGTEILYTSQ